MSSKSCHISTVDHNFAGHITDIILRRSLISSSVLGHAHHSRMGYSGHRNIFIAIDLIAGTTIIQPGLSCSMQAHRHRLLRAKTSRRSWARQERAIITVVNPRTSAPPCLNQRLLIDHLVRSLSQGPHRSFSL